MAIVGFEASCEEGGYVGHNEGDLEGGVFSMSIGNLLRPFLTVYVLNIGHLRHKPVC